MEMYKEFKIKGSIFTMLSVSIIIILVALVSVLPSISAAYAMHEPLDTWPYPKVYDELAEHHNQVEQALNIQVEDVLST